jgi:hypothetical protein
MSYDIFALIFPICCGAILTPPNIYTFLWHYYNYCRALFRGTIAVAIAGRGGAGRGAALLRGAIEGRYCGVLLRGALRGAIAGRYCAISVIDARVTVGFPICCGAILPHQISTLFCATYILYNQPNLTQPNLT